jgi:hypothetical protein
MRSSISVSAILREDSTQRQMQVRCGRVYSIRAVPRMGEPLGSVL